MKKDSLKTDICHVSRKESLLDLLKVSFSDVDLMHGNGK